VIREGAEVQYEHHERALASLTRQVEDEGIFDALIITGSVPRGTARPDSDIDCYVLVGDDEYEQRKATGNLAWFTGFDYPGGYADGKVISRSIVDAAADHGSEPTRASYDPAIVAFSRIGDLQPVVDVISVYPEDNRAANMRDFYAASSLHASYFGPQALETENPLLLAHAAAMTVLYGGRAVLAYNRILFPCVKQLLGKLQTAPETPDGFVANAEELLTSPTKEKFADHLAMLEAFTDWGISGLEVLTRFMELDEWTWMTGHPELAQR
jgi:hypothetical protein